MRGSDRSFAQSHEQSTIFRLEKILDSKYNI